jgi:hypothetical protein
MCSAKDHVRSTLESGHLMVQNKCRLRANSGHWWAPYGPIRHRPNYEVRQAIVMPAATPVHDFLVHGFEPLSLRLN